MTFDSTRYRQLSDCIYKRVEKLYDSLSHAERTFFLLDWLDSQVHNGGWHQWYHNWSPGERRERIDQTVDALQEIGAIDTIILLRRAVDLLDDAAAAGDDPVVRGRSKVISGTTW